jgi:hypothetical protein
MIAGSMQTTENPPSRYSALKSRLATWYDAACRRIARGGTPLVVTVCTFMVVYGHPILAFAQQDEEGERRDARLEGYGTKVAMDTGGLGLTWIAFVILAVIGVSALFKSAKRSHLD